MVDTKEIQVFVSCPGDVETEKLLVKEVCEKITAQLRNQQCIVRLAFREWREIIGQFGINPQEQINTIININSYDIYIGIWWMRFGTKTGRVNKHTGEEFESGTHEEFVIALNGWNNNKTPTIYLFFKKPSKTIEKKSKEQFEKVKIFHEEQRSKGWVNKFQTKNEFKELIYNALYPKAFAIDNNLKQKLKINTIDQLQVSEITQEEVANVPSDYISRKVVHYTTLSKKKTLFLEDELQDLEQLLRTKQRIVLLGDAGSGKSTELRHLFFQLKSGDSGSVPLYKSLNYYTPDQGIENYLGQNWKNIPHQLITLLLDGLDEIQPQHFNTTIRQIVSFTKNYPQIKILITCRTNFFELPANNSQGTLEGFEPYFLKDINLSQVQSYYSERKGQQDSTSFVEEIFENSFDDLIAKPFFLMLLVDKYADTKSLPKSRAELYELFVLSRIELDESHFLGAIEIKAKKQKILKLLQKVALGMEILCKNYITLQELSQFINTSEIELLKYCTAFKKRDGEGDFWQFEHNNVQEYLAAKALSELPFESAIKFLTFEPDYNKLIPSWVNTLTFLFSQVDAQSELLKKLLQWLLDTSKEVIVKFEKEKIPDEIRENIFINIFSYYKNNDVWARSSMFSDKQLSRFGQTDKTLRFLIREIEDENGSRTNKLNAINLIGYFDLTKYRKKTMTLFFQLIETNRKDNDFIYTVLKSIKHAGFTEPKTVANLMGILGKETNQYIRSSLYSILLNSTAFEKYIDYYIDGYKLLDSKNDSGRDDTTLMDESWQLKECFKKVKSLSGLTKIIKFLSSSKRFEFRYDSNDILDAMIDNAIVIYIRNKNVFNPIYDWFYTEVEDYHLNLAPFFVKFFDQTETKSKAIQKTIYRSADVFRKKSMAIAILLDQENLHLLSVAFKKGKISNENIQSIYFDMLYVKNENSELLLNFICEKTDIQIQQPERIDHESIRRQRVQDGFSLLFDVNNFRREVLKVFEKEGKDELTSDDLFNVRRENNKYIELEDSYIESALRLLRDFLGKEKSVSKKSIDNWFEKPEYVEWYRISTIYNYLSNHKEIIVNDVEKKFIENWCSNNVEKVDFTSAIKVHDDGRYTFKNLAVYIGFFTKQFDFEYKDQIYLDMLSFDFNCQNDWAGISHIIDKIKAEKVNRRISKNLKSGIAFSAVLKNHIVYATENKLSNTYSYILKEIIDVKRQEYERNDLLGIYFKNTKDILGLKRILSKATDFIKWRIVDILIKENQIHYLQKYLRKVLKSEIMEDKVLAAERLVSMQDIVGLKFYIKWIESASQNELDYGRIDCLMNLRTYKAINPLMDLLEISYRKKIKIDRFDRLSSMILNALQNIALLDENYFDVKGKLVEFIERYRFKYENVNYLVYTIERMEEKYYMNKAQAYSTNDVLKKLKLFDFV